MKFECKRDELLNVLEIVLPAINSKSTAPILTNVFVDAKKDKIVFTATSLDIILISTLNITVAEIGSLLIPAQKLVAIIKELSIEDNVSITSNKDDKAMIIKAGNSTFKIACMPKSEYPKLPLFKDIDTIKVPQQTLKSLINKVSFAMLPDNSRPMLCGILFEFKKNTLTVVATDAKRIAIAKIIIINEIEKSFILPMKSVNVLTKMLTNNDININIEKSRISFLDKDTQFISNLIDGEFPAYEKAIPKESKEKLIINRIDFISALKKAALFTNSNSIGVQLKIDIEKIIISKQTEMDDAHIKLDCKFTKDMTIGFNPNYLLDILNNIKEASLEIELESSDRPALLRKKDDYIYIMLPTRI